MHGTFPKQYFEARGLRDGNSLDVCIAFGVLPVIIAVLVAVARSGTATTFADVIDVLSKAATAALM